MAGHSPLHRAGILAFLLLAIAVAIAALLSPWRDLPPTYHHFADERAWLGIPNFGNVASNVLFLVAGLSGLGWLFRASSRKQFLDERERWPYFLVFLGLILTAFGSAYYHLAPDNARLVWDRLPMTLVFMPLVAGMIAERVSVKLGLWLLPVLTAVGLASVLQWQATVQRGSGDFRFYMAVQVYTFLALIVVLLLPPRYTRRSDLLVVAGIYALAKVCELADRQIFAAGHIVAGHTLKHLAAGVSGYWVLRMLQKRLPISPVSR